jgi:hypothetical protein
MKMTKKNHSVKRRTLKARGSSKNRSFTSVASGFTSVASGFEKVAVGFENEITKVFLEMILMIKLWHWKTYSYATHKATNQLYGSLNENMDKFIEVLLGKTNVRIDLTKEKTLPLLDFKDRKTFQKKVDWFKGYLVNLENEPFMKQMSNTDLLNIRDEILANLNQFLYLLTLRR